MGYLVPVQLFGEFGLHSQQEVMLVPSGCWTQDPGPPFITDSVSTSEAQHPLQRCCSQVREGKVAWQMDWCSIYSNGDAAISLVRKLMATSFE